MRGKWLKMWVAVGWLASMSLAQAGPDDGGAFTTTPPAPPQQPTGAFHQPDDYHPIPADSAFTRPVSPNGFSEDCPCDEGPCPRMWQVGVDYTFVWFTRNQFPPLLTTGNAKDAIPGALGQPGTRVLVGDTLGEDFPASGVNVTLVRWLGEAGRWSVDARYMFMEQNSGDARFRSDSAGNPVLARPFFNPVTGREDADPRAIPNVMAGTARTDVTTNFQQAEANLRCYSSPRDLTCGGLFSALAGVRWIQLRERFKTADTISDLPLGSPLASDFFISDRFRTTNEFFGGQFRLSAIWRYSAFEFEVLGKLAIGCNHETANVSGLTTMTSQATGASVSDTVGLFAQRSNSGSFSDNRLTYVPELDVKVGVQLFDWLRIRTGYELLWMEKVIRPGDQIDRRVNVQPLLSPTQLGPALPAPPTLQTSTFMLQGLTVGLEILF